METLCPLDVRKYSNFANMALYEECWIYTDVAAQQIVLLIQLTVTESERQLIVEYCH